MTLQQRSHKALCLKDVASLVKGKALPSNSDADWGVLIPLAQANGCGPLLLSALQAYPSATIPEELHFSLQSERAVVAVQHLVASRMQRRVNQALAASHIPCLWLKGVVLAHTVYPSPELRPMVDIDGLVPYSERAHALAVVQQVGFTMENPQLFDGRDGLKHHYFLQHSAYHPLSLELHYRLLGPLDGLLTIEDQMWFWQHTADSRPDCAPALRTLQPEAHLLYLCAHAILQHGEADVRLIHLYDLDRLLAATPNFDWNLFFDGAVRLRWTYAADRALSLAHSYFDTPLPQHLLEELRARRPRTERTERAHRRQAVQTTTQAVLDDLAVMDWTSRVRAAVRILAPPPSYMRWRYGLDSNSGLPAAYARRTRRIVADILHSLHGRTRGKT